MTKTTKTLRLTFLNGEKKKTSISLPDAPENLSAEQVRGAMNNIAAAGVFAKDGVPYYQTPQSAAYVERNVNELFNDNGDSEADTADQQA